MKSESRTIINIIDTEKKELENNLRRAAAIGDDDSVHRYELQIQALKYVMDKVYRIIKFTDESAILDILRQNYGKCDTELVALNGNKYIINKDEPVGVQENLLQWHEDIEDKTVIPPIIKAINLDNIIEINTLS